MNVATRTSPAIEYKRISLDFPDGTKPRLLFRLVGLCAPKVNTICVIVDGSDSYNKGIKELGTLRKAIAQLPADWPVHFFKLSHTELFATQTISEFCRGEALAERFLEDEMSQTPSQFRGSFLRPCVEAIAAIRSKEAKQTNRVAFVLSDGQFTDFLPMSLPDWMTLRVVSNVPTTNDVAHFEHLQWGTNRLLGFINKYVPQFDDEIFLAVKGAPAETRFFSFSERRMQPWSKPGECVINAKQSATTFLIDCEPEQANKLSWWIRKDGELIELARPAEGEFSDERDLSAAINSELQGIQQIASFNLLFESETDSPNHHAMQAFFEAAESLARLRKRWSLSGLYDRLLEFSQSFGRHQDAQLDAVLLISAQAKDSLAPDQITAIGLSKASILLMGKDDRLGRFTAVDPFRMSFDRERRRWLVSTKDEQDLELGISSQLIELPIAYGARDVRVLFAKPERS